MRESLGRLALRTYPRDVARSQGEEMLSTMLDVGAESRLVFAFDLISLVVGGLRERTRGVASSGTRQLITDACSIGLLVFLVVPMGDLLGRLPDFYRFYSAQQLLVTLIICVSVPLLLVGYNRAVGIIGSFAIAVGVWITIQQGHPALVDVLNPFATMAIPAVCCLVLIGDRRRRPLRPWRLLWLLVPVLLAITLLPRGPFVSQVLGLDYQEAFLVLVTGIGVLRLPWDPRLALGCGLVWADSALRIIYGDIGFGAGFNDPTILWIAAVTLSVAFLRLSLMRRARPA
jgi:hypothetical protein